MKKILAIYNTVDNFITINEVLKNKFPKFEILTATSGEGGIEIVKNENIELIVLDIIAPNTKGFEILELLKKEQCSKNIPIVLLSVNKSDAISDEYGLEIGPNILLSKPLDIEEFSNQLQPDFKFAESANEVLEKNKSLERIVDEKQEEIHYQALLLLNITESVVSFDANFIIKSWNKGAEEMYGWKASEVIGKKYQDIIKPIFIDNDNSCEIIANQCGVIHLEAKHTCKNEKKIYVSKTKSPILDSKNNPIGNICIARDITKQKKAELEIKKLFEAVEQSPASIVITDVVGSIEYVNKTFTEITGYTFEEALGQNPKILSSGLTTKEEYKELWGIILSGETWRGEFLNCKKNGELYWEEALIKPIKNVDEKITNYLAVKLDITEKKRNETIQNIILNIANASQTLNEFSDIVALIQKELGRLIDSKNFYIALYNAEDDTINRVFYKDEKDEILTFPAGKTVTGLVIKEGKSYLLKEAETRKLAKEHSIEIVGEISKNWLGVPLKIKGKTTGAFVIQSYEDENAYSEKDKEMLEIISHQIGFSIERKQHEDQLKIAKVKALESEARYKGIIDSSPNGIVIHRNGKILLVNNEVLKMNDSTNDNDLIGKSLVELVHPDYLASVLNRIEILYKTEAQIPYEVEKFILKNGSITELETTSILTNFNGEKAVLTILRDVSELIKAKKKAEESDRLKSAFLANMSHEIRTPMSGILGFSELLKTPELSTDKQAKYIEIIEKSGRRLLSTINDIIDISKIEAGQVMMSCEEVNIKNLMNEIFDFFKPEAEAKGLNLFLNCLLDDKFKIIKTDSKLLNSILVNLVKNAIKFTHYGSVELGCKKVDNSVEFYVEDTGIGVALNRQKPIFERFVQADIEDRDAYEGSGLGLAISKSYIEILGGEIELESVENVGSKFTVILPVNSNLKTEKEINEMYVNHDVVAYTKKLKVLIAEDDEISVIYLSEILAHVSGEILVAIDGNEAIELFNEHKDIDLILMDIKMPYFNGYEVVEKIRKVNKEVIIIAQTSYAQTSDREKALSSGFNDYISKPISNNVLLTIIEKHVSK